MNRAVPLTPSFGGTLYSVEVDGSVLTFCPQSFVTQMFSLVYSSAMLQPLAGSTRVSPPSPPKLEPITLSPLRRIDWPLSCRPPETATPLPLGSAPTPTE